MRLIPEFSQDAELELDEIATFLVRNARQRADQFADAFDAAVARLMLFPESGIALPDGRRLTWVADTGYVIIYAVRGESLVIASVKHSSQKDS